MAARFNAEDAKAKTESKSNPFSREFDPEAARLKKGDAGYGKALAGSQTELRAQKAQAWVETEISKLVDVIREQGEWPPASTPSDVEATITFGVLFHVYADISDTLVGVLMRARKRKVLAFEADMLFQGVHDHVVIRVLKPPSAAA